ncbi:hypothetical protein SAMN05444143_10127 [Flavobacterium succinicans]|uniref:Uncharacterized protein n=1 Tax=Flavobacterium succinicans TaxID=29536 RepID=A0A1I4QSR9_9FLAO|nr:hypothetical protein SAMN05444143_10127 [Flavobacterium succinicans]
MNRIGANYKRFLTIESKKRKALLVLLSLDLQLKNLVFDEKTRMVRRKNLYPIPKSLVLYGWDTGCVC